MPATAATAAPAGFPTYQYIGTPFNKANLCYNPTNELIFPTVRGVYGKLSNRLARYYLYFAAHVRPAASVRRIFWGWSSTGKNFSFDPTPRIWPSANGQNHISAPSLLKRNGTCYVVYLTEVG